MMENKKIELKKLKKAIYLIVLLTNFGISSYAIKEINDIKNELEKERTLEDEENAEVKERTLEDEENAEVKERALEDGENTEVEVKEENIEPENTLSITREEAEELFIEGKVDKMESSYQLSKLSNPDVTVRTIYKDDKKYLVDANDICHVYLADYTSYGGIYYDKYKDLYYYVVLKNDMHYFINAKDFSIILGDMDDHSGHIGSEGYYLSNYDYKNGGLDNNSEYSGYVMEVVNDGIRYLVDAEDSTKIIAYGFKDITEENNKIIFTYPDGNVQILSGKDLLITKTDILTKRRK